ncbi:SDR family NAD(P)-dependent oxidoreductase [Promicromonospora sp. NPDC052451]|uniref:SDR family NAD(P)-dependent oxidoreductase n=1 Tax=Promicromonospora sp. NPDC052451 TaxID=3364407 RepID=UPI0037C98DC7
MKDLRAYGSYAVVTGASSGIGAEFARQLAAAGLDLVLVARRRDRLAALAAELADRHGTASRVVVLDLLDDGAVAELRAAVADLDVGMVVANAGTSVPGVLTEHSLADELDVLTLNGTVTLQLAHGFGQDFARRGRGAVVLLSSMIAAVPVPYQANFAAVKAYVSSLGQALNHELKRDGVDVLVLSPGQTRTEGLDNTPGIDFDRLVGRKMDPSRVVRAALDGLGRRAHVVPGVVNNVADLMSRYLMPRRLSVRMYGRLIGGALVGDARSVA